jgi:carbonic anhydrase
MKIASPLPEYLVRRYHGWRATSHAENAAWFRRLAEEGQRPRTMVISCCDSRVNITHIFGADQGEFFMHRNIANLVPPYNPDGDHHGTSAAIEYGVTALNVANLIVVGHSQCGGVAGCDAMCNGHAPELEAKTSFVGTWLNMLRPGHERVKDLPDEERLTALEKEGVIVSLENLATFPFISERIADGRLALHGLWKNIADGTIEGYDPEKGAFAPL